MLGTHAGRAAAADAAPADTDLGDGRARAQAEGVKPREVRFTRRQVREATGWGDTQLRVHLGRLEEMEYLLVRREAGRMVYELVWDGEGQDGAPFLMGLIDVEALGAERAANKMSYDDGGAGAKSDFAGRLRPDSGPVAGPSRGVEHGEKPSPARPLADPLPPPPETRVWGGMARRS